MTRRLPTSPESTPRDGGIAYTIQAVMEDTPMNNSLHFMESVDMLVLNDSEGVIQSSKNREMTGGNTYALLRPEVDLWNWKRFWSNGILPGHCMEQLIR